MNRLALIATNDSEHLGGSEALWLQCTARLRLLGIHVAASLSPRVRGSRALETLQQSVNTVDFREPQGGRNLIGRIVRRFRAADLDRWLTKVRPDYALISAGDYLQGGAASAACLRRRIPYALLVQAASDHFGPEPEQFELLREAYRRASGVYFVSHANLRLTERRLALSLPGAKVVRNPFNVAYTASPAWPSEGPWRMACVARIDAFAKGIDLLFESLRAPEWRARDFELRLYGSGPHRVGLTELATRWGLQRVVFEGETRDIEAVWQQNHLLVLPSRQEGLPLALVEAALCARAAMITDVAGNAEVVEDGVTGFIARGPEVGLVRESLERAWDRRHDWRAMGLAAAARIRREVTPDPGAVFASELMQAAGFVAGFDAESPRPPIAG